MVIKLESLVYESSTEEDISGLEYEGQLILRKYGLKRYVLLKIYYIH